MYKTLFQFGSIRLTTTRISSYIYMRSVNISYCLHHSLEYQLNIDRFIITASLPIHHVTRKIKFMFRKKYGIKLLLNYYQCPELWITILRPCFIWHRLSKFTIAGRLPLFGEAFLRKYPNLQELDKLLLPIQKDSFKKSWNHF